MTKSRRGQPTEVATTQQLKLAHSRNFNETVYQPTNSFNIVTCYHADEMTLKNRTFHIKDKNKAMPGFAGSIDR